MKEVYNKLFSGELTVFNDCYGDASICDSLYHFCDIHNVLAHDDGKARKRAEYIVNAVNSYADMHELLELAKSLMDGDSIEDLTYKYKEIDSLLKKARGEK